MSSQFEFLDLSDLEDDEYHGLLNIIVNTKNKIYEPSQEISETQQDVDEFDPQTEDSQDCCEDDFLSSSRNETSVTGISFFVDGGTAEDIDPEEIPPMLQAEKTSEVSVVEQEEMVCINEQINLYSCNSPAPQPSYMNQPPPPPNMQHNFPGSGTHVYNMAHPNYPPHTAAGMPPVANTMYSHLPPGHPPHMGPPTVYVENCHVNFSPYGTHQQPPGALYATPPPSYHQGPHQHVYNPYIISDQSSVPMQVKVAHEKGEYDRNKRHDQHNRGTFRGRVRGRGRRRGRDDQERSNSVSSDHSSYSDSGVRSYKENCPAPSAPANSYNPNMYSYPYPIQYAINSMPRPGTTFPILHPQFLHDPYANHQSLMAYPPLQSMSVGPPVPHDHTGHASHSVECDPYTLQQCHYPEPHSVVQQQQQQIAASHSAYMVASNHGNQQSECLYSDSSLEQGNADYNYTSTGPNFSHEQAVHDIEDNQGIKVGVYRSENMDNDEEIYDSYSKESFVSKQSDLKIEDFQSTGISYMEMAEPQSSRDDIICNLISSSGGEQMEINVEDIQQLDNRPIHQQREKQTIIDQCSDSHSQPFQQVEHSNINKCFNDASLTVNEPEESPAQHTTINNSGESNYSKSNICCSPTISFLGPTISNGTKECLEKPLPVQSALIHSKKEVDEKANDNSLSVMLESVSLKEKIASVSPSSKNCHRSSPHEIELDASCTFADIEESNNIIKSPSGSLTVYKSSAKVKHVDNQSLSKVKNKCDFSNNTTNSSRSSSKESLKELPIKFHDLNLSPATESVAALDYSLNSESTVQMPTQEAAWGQKKSWSQLFKPNEDTGIPCKPIGYVSPFNAQENGKDCTKSLENTKKDKNINYSDLEAEKSKIGALLMNFSPDYRPVQLVPRGLINKNYWCYVNAPLQALLACPSFYQLMMSISKEAGINSGNTSTPFINSVVDIATEFTVMPTISKASRKEKGSTIKKEPDVITGNPFEPTCVYKMLINCKENQFTEGRQQDAEEMLSCVLNGLHDELVESLKLAGGYEEPTVNGTVNGDKNNCDYDISEDEHEWKVQGPKKKSCITRTAHFTPSPISQIFWGRLRSVLQQAGGSMTANLQPFNSLPLDIQSPKVDSLKDALNQLVTREEISGFTCPKTNQEVNASNQVMLEDLPRVLILQLKRFIYDKDGGLQKVTKRLQFTIDLEITKDLISLNSRGKFTSSQRKYKLFAIVNHEGKEATKGHYVADVFHTGYNCWLRYDDSSVKPIQEAVVLRHEPPRVPYLLFYRRNDTFANPNSNNNNSNNSIISNSTSNNSKPK